MEAIVHAEAACEVYKVNEKRCVENLATMHTDSVLKLPLYPPHRKRILDEDMSYDTLPLRSKLRTVQPGNLFVGLSKDKRIISYQSFGAKMAIIGEVLTVDEYVECVVYAAVLKEIYW